MPFRYLSGSLVLYYVTTLIDRASKNGIGSCASNTAFLLNVMGATRSDDYLLLVVIVASMCTTLLVGIHSYKTELNFNTMTTPAKPSGDNYSYKNIPANATRYHWWRQIAYDTFVYTTPLVLLGLFVPALRSIAHFLLIFCTLYRPIYDRVVTHIFLQVPILSFLFLLESM